MRNSFCWYDASSEGDLRRGGAGGQWAGERVGLDPARNDDNADRTQPTPREVRAPQLGAPILHNHAPLQGGEDDEVVARDADAGAALLDGLHRVLDLEQAPLRRPGCHVCVILICRRGEAVGTARRAAGASSWAQFDVEPRAGAAAACARTPEHPGDASRQRLDNNQAGG